MQPRTIGLWTALCDGWARALNLPISGAVNRSVSRPLILRSPTGSHIFVLPEDSDNRAFLYTQFMELAEAYLENRNCRDMLGGLRRRMEILA